jgi:hypothetical protein
MNGYVRININGQPIGIKFAYPAITSFYVAADKKKDSYYAGENLTYLGAAKLIHCAYLNNCEITEEEPKLTVEDFYNWTEEAMINEERAKELATVLTAFSESQYVKTLTEKKEVEEKTKKKTSKSTSKKLKAES